MNKPQGLPGATYPAGCFIQFAIDYGTPLTEADPSYHLGSALVTLSTVIGKKVYIQWGDRRLYPNIYLCLIGKSSLSRKTTSASIQKRILGEYDKNLVLPDQYTGEKLITYLQDHPTAVFYISEFGGFLRACTEKSYMAGVIELLTELFDCPTHFKRHLQSREYEVENPCLSILATSTVEWIVKNIKEHDIRGGFIPRILFFIADQIGNPIPIPPPPDWELRSMMLEELQKLGEIEGQASLSPQAKARYEAWYIQNFHALQQEDSLLTGAYTRLSDYCVKVAMLYELSASCSLVVSEDAMKRAIKLIEYLKCSLKRLVQEEMTFSVEMARQKKVSDIIRMNPGISKSDLLKKSRLSSKELGHTLETLIEAEAVDLNHQKGENNKTVTFYFPKYPQIHDQAVNLT